MTSVFNGMAGVLNMAFGAPVDVTSDLGVVTTIRAIFRDEPVEIPASDGRPMLIQQPTVKVQRDQMGGIARGYTVQPSIAPGRDFLVLEPVPNTSPATDGFIYVMLEEILP